MYTISPSLPSNNEIIVAIIHPHPDSLLDSYGSNNRLTEFSSEDIHHLMRDGINGYLLFPLKEEESGLAVYDLNLSLQDQRDSLGRAIDSQGRILPEGTTRLEFDIPSYTQGNRQNDAFYPRRNILGFEIDLQGYQSTPIKCEE